MPDLLALMSGSLNPKCPPGGAAVVFRMHDIGGVFFPICVYVHNSCEGHVERVERVTTRYFLYPTQLPPDADGHEQERSVTLEKSSPISQLLNYGRVPVALGLTPPIRCRFFSLVAPTLILGIFEAKETSQPVQIDSTFLNYLAARMADDVQKWENDWTYSHQIQAAFEKGDVLKILADLAADTTIHPPYAPFLHVKAWLMGNPNSQVEVRTNKLSYNCFLQSQQHTLAYLHRMAKETQTEPWEDDLLDDMSVTNPVAKALVAFCLDIVKPRGSASDNKYRLLPRHNKVRVNDSNLREAYRSRRDPYKLFDSNWAMVDEALHNLVAEADDILLATWIAERCANDATHVMPVGVNVPAGVSVGRTQLADVSFPPECKITRGDASSAIQIEVVCLPGPSGESIHPNSAKRLDDLWVAAERRIGEISDPGAVYGKWHKKIDEGAFFVGNAKHDLFEGGENAGLPLEGVPATKAKQKFRTRSDYSKVEEIARGAVTEFGHYWNWNSVLNEQLTTRLLRTDQSGVVQLFCFAKSLSSLDTIWLPLLWLTCPDLKKSSPQAFNLDQWYRLRARIEPKTPGIVLQRFRELADELQKTGGSVRRSDWGWDPLAKQANYYVDLVCSNRQAKEVAGDVAKNESPGTHGLRKVLYLLKESGIWVCSSAMTEEKLRIVISLAAEPIP